MICSFADADLLRFGCFLRRDPPVGCLGISANVAEMGKVDSTGSPSSPLVTFVVEGFYDEED